MNIWYEIKGEFLAISGLYAMLKEPLFKTFGKTSIGQCIFLTLSSTDYIVFIGRIRVNIGITGK